MDEPGPMRDESKHEPDGLHRPVVGSGPSEAGRIRTGEGLWHYEGIEKAPWASERQFRDLLEKVSLIVVTLDVEGKVTFCNDAILRLLGWSRAEIIGRNWFEQFVPPAGRDEAKRLFFECIRQGTILPHHENEIQTRQGKRLLVTWSNTMLRDADGWILGTASIGEDVTERKRAEEALCESEERQRVILDQMPEGVVFVDAHDRVRFVNTCACAFLGTSRQEIEGRNLQAAHMDPVRAWFAEILRSFREERPREAVSFRRLVRDREMIFRVSCVDGPDGGYRGSITNIVDITDALRVQQQMAEVRRMEAIGTLAGGIAHDFNNLMQTVLGGASHLKGKRPSDHPDYATLAEIERAADTAGKLAHQLLVYAKGGKLRPRLVSLADVIAKAMDAFAPSVPKRLLVGIEIARDLGQTECDTAQIERVIGDLCRNAVDAMPKGGRLTIQAENVTLTSPLRDANPPLSAGDYVCIAVQDTGCGMDAKTADRAFDPFFTTKADGHGLGLAAAWGIVKSHGGAIALTTKPGAGSTFRIWLPRARIREE